MTSILLTAPLVAGASVVAYGLLTGRIKSAGMLRDTAGSAPCAERVQLLVLAFGGTAAYTFYALGHVGEARLPDIPSSWVGIAGGSQIIYVVSKLMRSFGRS